LTRRALLAAPAVLAAHEALAQQPPAKPIVGEDPPEKPVEFLCPMDPEVRAKGPGKCPRCGMKLLAGLPDPLEFRLDLSTAPRQLRAGQSADLKLVVVHPKTGKPVRDFELIHEKLFHLFIVSEDLKVFAHEHPEPPVIGAPPEFTLNWTFPKPGMYRLMADYYPLNATPQLTVKTLFVAAGERNMPIPALPSNTQVQLTTEPAQAIAGEKTRLYFTLNPASGLTPWLGAWGHVLVASADTVDLIHTHPFIADGGARMQFNVIFPRPGKHKVWVQFERAGLVNSAGFDVDVKAL
jgi:hypothetical protein